MLWSNQHLSYAKELSRRELLNSLASNLIFTEEDLLRAGEDPEVRTVLLLGIDNRMRRRFRGNKKMPKIGYGSDNATKFFLPNGLKKFVVHNSKDLDVLLMNNRTFCAEIAHNVSSRVNLKLSQKRTEIVKRAQQIRVKLTISRGKVRTEEKKQEA